MTFGDMFIQFFDHGLNKLLTVRLFDCFMIVHGILVCCGGKRDWVCHFVLNNIVILMMGITVGRVGKYVWSGSYPSTSGWRETEIRCGIW